MKTILAPMVVVVSVAMGGCAYHGSPQTAVEAARVQLARRGVAEAYQCEAVATQVDSRRFEIACDAHKTQVTCSSTRTDSCCVALSGDSEWESVSGDNPMVCDEHRY